MRRFCGITGKPPRCLSTVFANTFLDRRPRAPRAVPSFPEHTRNMLLRHATQNDAARLANGKGAALVNAANGPESR